MRSYSELEDLLWQELSDIIASNKAGAVRRSWQPNGAPDWTIGDDVLFMQLAESEDDINLPLDYDWKESGEDLDRRTGVTRVFTLRLTAYGPNCYDNLLRVRMAFLAGRQALKANQVYLVPERAAVVRAPELFQNRWWNRADTELKLNALFVFDEKVGTITRVDVSVGANRQGSSKTVISEIVCVK